MLLAWGEAEWRDDGEASGWAGGRVSVGGGGGGASRDGALGLSGKLEEEERGSVLTGREEGSAMAGTGVTDMEISLTGDMSPSSGGLLSSLLASGFLTSSELSCSPSDLSPSSSEWYSPSLSDSGDR
jgi:hypothetical protein